MAEGPAGKKQLAVRARARLGHSTRDAAVPPRQARRLVFSEAVRTVGPRDTVLARVASSLDVTPEALEASLFADLPGERIMTGLAGPLSPTELALRANLALTQALLFRATGVTLEVEGNARTLVRHAKLRGLICTVSRGSRGMDTVLEDPLRARERTPPRRRPAGALARSAGRRRRSRMDLRPAHGRTAGRRGGPRCRQCTSPATDFDNPLTARSALRGRRASRRAMPTSRILDPSARETTSEAADGPHGQRAHGCR